MDTPGGPTDMQRLAGVLLHVHAGDADPMDLPVNLHVEPAVLTQRLVVLADLEVLRHVRVEVVLARESAPGRDRAVQCQADHHGEPHGGLVDHRQRARQPQAGRAHLGVGLRAEHRGTAAEHLRGGAELDVCLQPDHRLVAGDGVVEGGGRDRHAGRGCQRRCSCSTGPARPDESAGPSDGPDESDGADGADEPAWVGFEVSISSRDRRIPVSRRWILVAKADPPTPSTPQMIKIGEAAAMPTPSTAKPRTQTATSGARSARLLRSATISLSPRSAHLITHQAQCPSESRRGRPGGERAAVAHSRPYRGGASSRKGWPRAASRAASNAPPTW